MRDFNIRYERVGRVGRVFDECDGDNADGDDVDRNTPMLLLREFSVQSS